MPRTSVSKTQLCVALENLNFDRREANERAAKILANNNNAAALAATLVDIDQRLGEMKKDLFTPYARKKYYRYYQRLYAGTHRTAGAGGQVESHLDTWNLLVYLYFTLSAVTIAAAALAGYPLPILSGDNAVIFSSFSWNESDTLTGVGASYIQHKMGEKKQAKWNAISSTQQQAITLTALLLEIFKLISVSGAGAMMSPTFAVSTGLSWYCEWIEVEQSKKRLKELVAKYEVATPDDQQDIMLAIQAETHNLAYHERNKEAWMWCTIAMVAIGIVAFFALSAVTLGAVPIATCVVTAAAFVSSLIRSIWVNKSWERFTCGGQSLEDNFKTRHKLIGRLYTLPSQTLSMELDKSAELGWSIFGKTEITPRDYLRKLVDSNLAKASNLIQILEDSNQALEDHNQKNFTDAQTKFTAAFPNPRLLEKFQNKVDPEKRPLIASVSSTFSPSSDTEGSGPS